MRHSWNYDDTPRCTKCGLFKHDRGKYGSTYIRWLNVKPFIETFDRAPECVNDQAKEA